MIVKILDRRPLLLSDSGTLDGEVPELAHAAGDRRELQEKTRRPWDMNEESKISVKVV